MSARGATGHFRGDGSIGGQCQVKRLRTTGNMIKLDFIRGRGTRPWVRPRSFPRGRHSGGDREKCVGMVSISIASCLHVAVAAVARLLALVQPSPAQTAHGGHGWAGSFPWGVLSIGGF